MHATQGDFFDKKSTGRLLLRLPILDRMPIYRLKFFCTTRIRKPRVGQSLLYIESCVFFEFKQSADEGFRSLADRLPAYVFVHTAEVTFRGETQYTFVVLALGDVAGVEWSIP